MESIFKLYSIGLVAENKPRNDRFANIVLVEDASGLDGEISFNPQEHRVKGQDKDGNSYEVVTTMDITFNCEWLPSGTNRITPPDIVRGELVEVYRLGDTDQYYWRTMGLRDNLRTLETVILAFSATPSYEGKPLSLDHCYFLEVSTHDKLVTFSTSKANGEPFVYTAQFNTAEGQFILNDDIGNQFELISRERILKMFNVDGSFLDINKKKITINADEEIKLICGGTTTVMRPESVTTTTMKHQVITDDTDWVQVGAGITVTTPDFDII